MKILLSLISSLALAQTATIKWKDVATPEVVQLQPCGGQALCLSVRNPGKSDNWGNASWAPQPKFFETVDATVPGYGVLTADLQDIQYNIMTGVHSLARANQYHYAHKRYGTTWSHPAYTGSDQFHMLDGGDTLYFRFVPLSDPFELTFLTSTITQARKDKALQIANLDEQRIAQWPFLQKIMNLYKPNFDPCPVVIPYTNPVQYLAGTLTKPCFFNEKAPVGKRDMAWLIRPENFAERWWGAASQGGLPAMKHWYGLGTKAAAEGFSNEHYGHAAHFLIMGLRNNDVVGLTTGLTLLRQKIAYGLIDSDVAHPVKGFWRNEKSNLNRGNAGTAPGPAKEYDLDIAMAYTLLPEDPLIARAYDVRKTYHLAQGPVWHGSGGARILGHHLENLLDMYHASSDPALKAKAEQNITHAFSANINGDRLWFREYTATSPSCGEGGMVLPQILKWVHQEGALPGYTFAAPHPLAGTTLVAHLQNMTNWYVTYCGMWQKSNPALPSPDLWKPGYYGSNATPTSLTVTYNSDWQGVFWMQLRPFISPAQADAIEKKAFTSITDPNFDAANGGMGPSSEKWIPMFFNAARK